MTTFSKLKVSSIYQNLFNMAPHSEQLFAADFKGIRLKLNNTLQVRL